MEFEGVDIAVDMLVCCLVKLLMDVDMHSIVSTSQVLNSHNYSSVLLA